jgi:hypothetical protein
MSKTFRIFLILVLVAMSLPVTAVQADPLPLDKAICEEKGGIYGSTPDNSNFCLWLPSLPPYEGDLLIFAHGYVDPREPAGSIPWGQLALTDPALPIIVTGQLKTAFAITSYSQNGLAVIQGVKAVIQLAKLAKNPPPELQHIIPIINNIYLVGASEGGLVTAQAIEQNPEGIFSGGVTSCGPIGDFKAQVNYWGDFRVAFDYFFQDFKTRLAGPIWINPDTRDNWKELSPVIPLTSLQSDIVGALANNPVATKALLNVSKAPIDPTKPESIAQTVLGILDYNVRATNQARMELSGNYKLDGTTNEGNPFGNNGRLYWGSGSFMSDWQMNQWIKKNDTFTADPKALDAIQLAYQTTGKIQAPLVALHTTGDPIVPFWHEWLYQAKIWKNGNGGKFFSIPVARYGHCAFTAKEAVFAYAVMVFKATKTLPLLPMAPQSDENILTQQDYNNMLKQYEPKMIFIPMVSQ